jgi:HAD superfamily hydrolase (TIGR01509 family)
MQAVAFDMDGLMFNTEDIYWKAADALLRKRGRKYTQELCAAIMGRTPQYCFELFRERFGFSESWQELQRESEDFFLEFLNDGYSTMPGLTELLEFLEQKRIPKAVCTSSAVRVVDEVLRRKNMKHRFEFVLTAEDITNGKPNPEIYLKAAARFGIEPQEMLVLEDSVAGSQAARTAGAHSVVVLAEHNKDGDFSAANLIVDSLNSPKILELF